MRTRYVRYEPNGPVFRKYQKTNKCLKRRAVAARNRAKHRNNGRK